MYSPKYQEDRCRYTRVRSNGTRECPECTNAFKASKQEWPCVAHFDAARRRWCPAGEPPTQDEKGSRRKRGRSVYHSSGGLPSLGK